MKDLYQIYNTYKSSYTETRYFIDIELICVFRFLASSTIRDKACSIYKNNEKIPSEYNKLKKNNEKKIVDTISLINLEVYIKP